MFTLMEPVGIIPITRGELAAEPGRRDAAAGHFRQIGAIAMRFGMPHFAAAARGALV